MENNYNLMEIRQLYGLNQTDFARKAKMSRELVSKIENGKIEMKKPTWKKVQRFLQDNPMVKNSQDVNIMGISSLFHSHGSNKYLDSRRDHKNDPASILVPLVGIKAQAGYVKAYEQVDYMDSLEKYSLPPGVNSLGAIWRYFEVDGDSMEPTLSAGDVILATMVHPEDWSDVKNFCIYIIHTADKLLVKRVYKRSPKEWVLISDNEEQYPQVPLLLEEVKQVWQLRRHIRSKAPQPKEFKIIA
jgi:phage repressor protein C with HTH and peptisase S24 domain